MLAGDHLVEQVLQVGELGRVLGLDVGHRPIFVDEHCERAHGPWMGHTAGLSGWGPGASTKKQPAGATDGPAGVKKVAGTGFEPVTSRL